MSNYPTLSEASLQGKRVLLRAGFDLPMENGAIQDISRVEALVPTMKYILSHGASLIILAHQGRPKGKVDPAFTQKPIVPVLEKLLGTNVHFAASCTGPDTKSAADSLKPGDVLLLENLRYDPREEKNDLAFAKELASLGDIYVNDAFTNCHRAHASMVGIPALLPSYMGLQLEQEVSHLSKIVESPEHPLTLIVSGAKMETKVPVIEFFRSKGDDILVGGAIANTFIAAKGNNVGRSLVEPEYVEQAKEMLHAAGAAIHVPFDAIVATEPKDDSAWQRVNVDAIPAAEAIYDVGDATVAQYIGVIEQSKTIVWNGPLGMYEVEPFAAASKRIAAAVLAAARRGAFVVIGGGDTIDLHTRYNLPLNEYSFVSTGGGAMLEFVSGETLPALAALQKP
jgi:phosphoglycerate kinase